MKESETQAEIYRMLQMKVMLKELITERSEKEAKSLEKEGALTNKVWMLEQEVIKLTKQVDEFVQIEKSMRRDSISEEGAPKV